MRSMINLLKQQDILIFNEIISIVLSSLNIGKCNVQRVVPGLSKQPIIALAVYSVLWNTNLSAIQGLHNVTLGHVAGMISFWTTLPNPRIYLIGFKLNTHINTNIAVIANRIVHWNQLSLFLMVRRPFNNMNKIRLIMCKDIIIITSVLILYQF